MASKYARRHYEDVAALLKTHAESALKSDTHYETDDLIVVEGITADFIRLFLNGYSAKLELVEEKGQLEFDL